MLIILGEAPGETEVSQQRPFVGKSGKLLRSSLQELNINNYYITNVVKIRPENNRTPSALEIKSWINSLRVEFDLLKNTFNKIQIIAFGKTAERSVVLLNEIHYNTTPIEFKSVWHPAYVLRTHKYELWKKSLKETLNSFNLS